MMLGFIDENGNYFEADADILGVFDESGNRIGGPEIVDLRPDGDHVRENGAWVPRVLSLAEVQEREKAQVSNTAANKLGRVDDGVRRMVVLLAEGKPVPAALLAKVKKNDLIEDTRDAALVQIDAAATKAAARAVAPAIVWP